MREIKFRAWEKNEQEMCLVTEIHMDAEEIIKVGLQYKNVDYSVLRFPSSVELMQYTGIKDKTGREIYEGDVVGRYSDEGNEVYVEQLESHVPLDVIVCVKWNPKEACFGLYEKFLNNVDKEYTEDWHGGDLSFSGNCKVIGNIYEPL